MYHTKNIGRVTLINTKLNKIRTDMGRIAISVCLVYTINIKSFKKSPKNAFRRLSFTNYSLKDLNANTLSKILGGGLAGPYLKFGGGGALARGFTNAYMQFIWHKYDTNLLIVLGNTSSPLSESEFHLFVNRFNLTNISFNDLFFLKTQKKTPSLVTLYFGCISYSILTLLLKVRMTRNGLFRRTIKCDDLFLKEMMLKCHIVILNHLKIPPKQIRFQTRSHFSPHNRILKYFNMALNIISLKI